MLTFYTYLLTLSLPSPPLSLSLFLSLYTHILQLKSGTYDITLLLNTLVSMSHKQEQVRVLNVVLPPCCI